MLGLSEGSTLPIPEAPEGAAASDEVLREILEEVRALHKDLPRILAACLKVTLVIGEREFGRLVHDAEGWYW